MLSMIGFRQNRYFFAARRFLIQRRWCFHLVVFTNLQTIPMWTNEQKKKTVDRIQFLVETWHWRPETLPAICAVVFNCELKAGMELIDSRQQVKSLGNGATIFEATERGKLIAGAYYFYEAVQIKYYDPDEDTLIEHARHFHLFLDLLLDLKHQGLLFPENN